MTGSEKHSLGAASGKKRSVHTKEDAEILPRKSLQIHTEKRQMRGKQNNCARFLTNPILLVHNGFPGVQLYGIHLPMQEPQIQSLSREDPLEKGMATHSSCSLV